MIRIFGKLSLVSRALILIGVVAVLTTGCAVAAAYWALNGQLETKARNDIEIFKLVDTEGLTPLLMVLNEPGAAKTTSGSTDADA